MSRLVRIERIVMLIAVAVLVVGILVLVDLREAGRLRFALQQMAEQSASCPTMRPPASYTPGRLPEPQHYRFD